MALIPCVKCNSSGGMPDPLNPELTIECSECRGVGQKETDWVGTISQLRKLITANIATRDEQIADIKDKVNDIKEKCDEIFEKVK